MFILNLPVLCKDEENLESTAEFLAYRCHNDYADNRPCAGLFDCPFGSSVSCEDVKMEHWKNLFRKVK